MNQLVAFNFESSNVRVVMGDNGEPMFVAADVCQALTIDNHRNVLARLDDDEKGVHLMDTPGGPQKMTVVNESGLYSLILGSRKPEAKRFKRWVTHEVLPSIRKTGAYSVAATALPALTQDKVNAILSIGEAIARVPGVKTGIAMAATLNCIQENTGLSTEVLRRALPSANEPICSLNPTQVGERVGMSARTANMRLQSLGFQPDHGFDRTASHMTGEYVSTNQQNVNTSEERVHKSDKSIHEMQRLGQELDHKQQIEKIKVDDTFFEAVLAAQKFIDECTKEELSIMTLRKAFERGFRSGVLKKNPAKI